MDRLVDGGCLNGSTGCACGSRVMVGEWVGEQQGGWLVGGPWVETQSCRRVGETSRHAEVHSALPVPAWPAAAASPHPPRRGPAGPAHAAPSGPARSPPDAAWHPRPPSARPPAPSPAFAGRWPPVQPRGGLAPAHAPGRRVGRTRVSPAPLDHGGGGRPGPEPSARLEGRGA